MGTGLCLSTIYIRVSQIAVLSCIRCYSLLPVYTNANRKIFIHSKSTWTQISLIALVFSRILESFVKLHTVLHPSDQSLLITCCLYFILFSPWDLDFVHNTDSIPSTLWFPYGCFENLGSPCFMEPCSWAMLFRRIIPVLHCHSMTNLDESNLWTRTKKPT